MMKKINLLLLSIFMLSSCGTISHDEVIDKTEEKEPNSESSDSTEKKDNANKNENVKADKLVYNEIENEKGSLDSSIVTRTAYKSIKALSSYMMDAENTNYVLSPASYLLAVAGVVSVSDGFDVSNFGLSSDTLADVSSLLNAWNFKKEYEGGKSLSAYSHVFKSAILHQQVGDKYAFDDAKRLEFGDQYISSMVSSQSSYREDAQEFFKEKISLNLAVPDGNLKDDGVATYSGLTVKDYMGTDSTGGEHEFNLENGESITVKGDFLGSEKNPRTSYYYKGDNYTVFRFYVHETAMIVVLPDLGTDVNTIDVSEAYNNYISSTKNVKYYGFVPFFHVSTNSTNLTDAMRNNMNGKEQLYSKLLKDDVVNDLELSSVLQSNDFEFNQYGISGESCTVASSVAGDSKPKEDDGETPIEIIVDRPYYAISIYNDFPLFVSKVNDPSKTPEQS